MTHILAGMPVSRRGALTLLAVLTVVSTAAADITITTKESSEGLGGFGNTNGTTTKVVTPSKALDESESQYTGRFKTFAGGKDHSTQIVRLDRGVVWSVDHDKKQYTEMTFDQMREQMRRGMEEMKKAAGQLEEAKAEARAKSKEKDAEVTTSFETDVQRSGEKQTIAGLSCEHAIVTCISKVKDAKTGAELNSTKFVMDGWYTKKMPGEADVIAFERAYAEKMGLDQFASKMAPMAAAMYGDALKEIGTKLNGLGYSVKSTFTVQNVASEETKQAMAEARAEQKKARADAEKSQKRSETTQDAAEAASIGSAAASGGGGVKGMIGGFLGRKVATAAAKKVTGKAQDEGEQAAGAAESGVLLRTYSEVVSISSSSAPADKFELPAGYKKVAPKMVKDSK